MRCLASILAVAFLASCAERKEPLTTGESVSASALQGITGGATVGDDSYAVVSSSALTGFYDSFRAELFKHGVTKWDERFDCNHFAGYYVALAQTKYYLANFHSGNAPNTLALGVYWYRTGNGAHALVMALTERGILFIEPQTGKETKLTPAEQAGAFLKFFG